MSDGKVLAANLTSGAHTLSIPALGYSDTLKLTATASSALGTPGRTAVARSRYPAKHPVIKRHKTR
jgi:hypothetical protein